MRYNKRQIPKLEEKIRELIKKEGSDETKKVEEVVQYVTGPNAGLIYDPETGSLRLAEGWVYDEEENIVPVDEVIGPGV